MESSERLLCSLLLLLLTCLGCLRAAAQVRLSQETPCRTGGPCLLKCSVVSGTNQLGLAFASFQGAVVQCITRDDCFSPFPRLYNLTQVDYSTSYLEIRNFNVTLHQGTWSCFDSERGNTNRSSIHVQENAVPSGELTLGSPCASGSVTSPASLSCSGLSPGVPNATLTLTDSSSQTVSSSQTGSVTWTVTRGGQYTCSVSWSAFPSFPLNISPVWCTVQIPPSVVPGNGSTVDVEQGRPTTLLCDSAGFPQPAFSWSHPGTTNTSNVNASVTRGSLTLVPDSRNGTLTRQVVFCNASNVAGSSSASVSINILFSPPGDPSVSGLPPGGVLYQGDDVNLTCEVTGGNPPVSSVTLTCPQGHASTTAGRLGRLQFPADRMGQGSCVCSASHVLGYSRNASVSITTFYPPSAPQVDSSEELPWLEGGAATLSCSSADQGRPAAQIQWLEGHGGQVQADGALHFSSLGAGDQGRRVECRAVNNFTSTKGLHLSANLTLDVHYPPRVRITPAVDSGVLTVVEDRDNVSLTCSASGNPSPGPPQWRGAGGRWGSTLTFDPVRRDQHGVYNCTATSRSSKFGDLTSAASFSLTVNYAPDVRVRERVESGARQLVCEAEGRPSSFRFSPWLQTWGAQPVRQVPASQQGGQSSLTLTSFQDSGTYTCTVENGVPDGQGQTTQTNKTGNITVEDVPQLPLPADPALQTGELGQTVRLYRTLYSEPAPANFTWYFNSSQVSASQHNVTSRTTDVLLPVHGVEVQTRGVNVSLDVTLSRESEGDYTLEVCNTRGCNSSRVRLQASGPPLAPVVTSTSSTESSIQVTWTPGFPGGDFSQWFHVQYRPQGGQWSDVAGTWSRNSTDRRPVSATVEGLSSGTTYDVRVRAQNSRSDKNLSNYTMVTVTIKDVPSPPRSNVGTVAGAVAGSVGASIIVVLVVIVLRRRKLSASGGKDDDEPITSPGAGVEMADDSSGVRNRLSDVLEDNILYESSNGLSKSDASGAAAFHPILEDNPLYESSTTPVPVASKNKESKKKTKLSGPGGGNVYAQVKKKPAAKREAYENVEMNKEKQVDNVYANDGSEETKHLGSDGAPLTKSSENSGPLREVHEDGCVYVTVESTGAAVASTKSSKPAKPPKPPNPDAYRDDAVIYTVIDHSKKAPTLNEDA